MTPTSPGGEPVRSPDAYAGAADLLITASAAAVRASRESGAAGAPPGVADAAVPACLPSDAAHAAVTNCARRFWTVVSSHTAVDFYAGVIPALSIALAAAHGLNERQLTALFVINSVMSGVSQPVFAWLTDKHDTRLCAPVGLALSATTH